jgi:hypothetical protein
MQSACNFDHLRADPTVIFSANVQAEATLYIFSCLSVPLVIVVKYETGKSSSVTTLVGTLFKNISFGPLENINMTNINFV